MAGFGNRRQLNENKVNTTTRVAQLYNPKGEDASTLMLGYWNNTASIKISPALPEDERSDNKVYDYDTQAAIFLGPQYVVLLHSGVEYLERQVLRAKKAALEWAEVEEEGKKKGGKSKKGKGAQIPKVQVEPVAVRVGDRVIKVGYGDVEGIDGYYVALAEVNDKGAATGILYFPFVDYSGAPENTLLVGWNEETGDFRARTVSTGWQVFKTFLDQAKNDLVGGGAHGSLHNLNFTIARLSRTLDIIKGMVEAGAFGSRSLGGDDSGQGGGFGGRRGGFGTRRRRNLNLGGDSGGESAGGGRKRARVEETEVDDISEIENEMLEEIDDIEDID